MNIDAQDGPRNTNNAINDRDDDYDDDQYNNRNINGSGSREEPLSKSRDDPISRSRGDGPSYSRGEALDDESYD